MKAANKAVEELKKLGLLIDPITDIQKQMLFDDHRMIITAAGRRSRKTLINKNKLLWKALKNPDGRYFHAAPTQQQAKLIFWDWLKKATKAINVRQSVSETYPPKVRLKNGSEIYVVGLDKPERVEGTPWQGCHITEMPDVHPSAFPEHIRPVLSDTNGFAYIDGVPDFRAPHYQDMAEQFAGGLIPKPNSISGLYMRNEYDDDLAFYSWLSSDVLNEKEIEAAKRQLDERVYRQEYEASFERPGGVVYYSYSNESDMNVEFEDSKPCHVSFDFNVNPMTSLIIQEFDGNKYCCTNEFVIHDSNTEETTKIVIDYLHSKNYNKDNSIILNGDYAGMQRATAASKLGVNTDWRIIRQMFDLHGFKTIPKYRPTTTIKDRVNSLNAAFKNTLNERKLFVNRANCPYLVRDLEKQTWTDMGKLEDQSGTIGHRSDALSYFAEQTFKIKSKVNNVI
jgi:hypothetical protein